MEREGFKYLTLYLSIFIFIIGCHFHVNALTNYSFDENDIIIEGDIRPFTSNVSVTSLENDRYEVSVYLHSITASTIPAFCVKVKFPREKINQLWNSQTWSNKSHFTLPAYDRAASSFSIISGLTLNDQNQLTFTCNDRFDASFISTSVQENGDSLDFCLDIFEENPPVTPMQEYEVKLLIDFRNIHFADAVYDASQWRLADKFRGESISVDTTKVPVYSTWYPMHLNIPLENIARELDSLKTFNFKSILVDDGWQTLVKLKIDTVYEYDKESLATMNSFLEKVKNQNLKFYLWYSLPFRGGNPNVMKKFEGKYVKYKAPNQIYVLDPRYREVRQHLISTYVNFFKQWEIDGFWFDFMDDFYPYEGMEMSEDLGRDYANINLATEDMMSELSSRMKTVSPDVFMGQDFEVVGPNQNTNQGELRGFVGVSSTKMVKEKMVNNRVIYGGYTPFMEIMSVHPRDKSEDVARKFQSIMFGNPYLSFYTTTLPDDTKQTIRFWLNFWKDNYELLLRGDFKPINVSKQYPVIEVENDEGLLYAVYEEYTLTLPSIIDKPLYIINSKESQEINLALSKSDLVLNYIILDHKGVVVETDQLKTKKRNSLEILVPEGGMVEITQ